jgi:hypothetical protein
VPCAGLGDVEREYEEEVARVRTETDELMASTMMRLWKRTGRQRASAREKIRILLEVAGGRGAFVQNLNGSGRLGCFLLKI